MSRILLVEDDTFLSSIISHELSNAGFEVDTAADGEIGLSHMRETLPDLVLLDILMPNMNGFEFLAAAKKDETLAHVPVLVLSNLGEQTDIDKAKALGAVGHYTKVNYTPQSIIEEVRKVLALAATK